MVKTDEILGTIDNFNEIKSLLNFENEGDFYMLYIFKRKKDQPENEKDNHQSVRTIKSYVIESFEYLEKKKEEIIQLCEMFRARAYIHVQKQNHKDVGLDMLCELSTRLKNGVFRQEHLFDSIVGKLKTYEKRWIVDIDSEDKGFLEEVIDFICDECRPVGIKVEKIIKTKSGFHLITERFDVIRFKKRFPEIDIQKKNPTLLYYPKSLNS